MDRRLLKNGDKKAEANPHFKFCPKFSQSISHIKRLKNADEVTTSFYEGISAFGDKLGPLFLQLSDNYTPKSFPELKAYLKSLPTDIPVYVELRHKDWYAVPEIRDEAFNMFHELNIGAVINRCHRPAGLCAYGTTNAACFYPFCRQWPWPN